MTNRNTITSLAEEWRERHSEAQVAFFNLLHAIEDQYGHAILNRYWDICWKVEYFELAEDKIIFRREYDDEYLEIPL